MESTESDIKLACKEIADLEKRLLVSQNQLALQQRREEEILGSTSWRITAPLRVAMARLRGRGAGAAVSPGRVKNAASTAQSGEGRPHPAQPTSSDDQENQALTERVRSLLPFFPKDCVANSDISPEVNHGFRLIDMAPAMESLLSEPARALLQAADDQVPSVGEIHVGHRTDAPAIAFLGSRELRDELAFDASVAPVGENGWAQTLVPGRFRFLLIEPVLHVGHRDWRYVLSAQTGRRDPILQLIAHCRQIGLPVVVWLRGGMDDYADFAWLAGHADRTYATDMACIDRLRADFPDAKVAHLEVAVQPALYNPVRPASLVKASNAGREKLLFDGWWSLVEGASEDTFLRALQDRACIVESEWDFGSLRLDDCAAFKDRALGCLSLIDRAAVGKLVGAELFLDTALVPDWRQRLMMFRAAASGSTPIAPDRSASLAAGLDIPWRGDRNVLATRLRRRAGDELAQARQAHVQFREVMSGHTVAHRLQRIADDLGLSGSACFLPELPKVACLLVTMRPQLLDQCLRRFREDRYPNKELIVVFHGSDVDVESARRMVKSGEPVRIFQLGRNHSLGACLNFAFGQTDAPYWTKIDDDDLYGPDYLTDLMLYQRVIDAPLMGKPLAFVYFEQGDELHWVPSWHAQRSMQLLHPGQGQAIVAGGTITGRREVMENVQFSERRRRGCDSDFLRRCQEFGYPILCTDPFNFSLFRSGQPGFHTWDMGEQRVRDRSRKNFPLADAAESFLI